MESHSTISQVKGVGSVRIRIDNGTTVLLTNVKYVPGMSKNLISLGILENQGCCFKSKDGVLKIIKGCITLLKAQRTGALYILKNSEVTRPVNDTIKIKEESSHRHMELVFVRKSKCQPSQKGMYHDNKSVTYLKISVPAYDEPVKGSSNQERYVIKEELDHNQPGQWSSPSVILPKVRRSLLDSKEMVLRNGKENFENQQSKGMTKLRHKEVSMRMKSTIAEKMKNMFSEPDLLNQSWTEATVTAVNFRSSSSSSSYNTNFLH